MKTTRLIAAAALLTAAIAVAEHPSADKKDDKKAEKDELKPQTVCPVMGGKINKAQYIDHEGQRIYVCCPGCFGALKKDPEKYIKKMAENGEKPAKLQTHCPVMGGKINKEVFVDVKGKRIYLCCAGCSKPIKDNPEKYIKKLEDSGVTLDTTPSKKK